MTTREEEMAKLRTRYAEQRHSGQGQGKDLPSLPWITQPETTTEKTKKKTKERRKIKDVLAPYIFLIKNDLRRLFRMKPKQEQKPLDLTWLKKKEGGRFW